MASSMELYLISLHFPNLLRYCSNSTHSRPSLESAGVMKGGTSLKGISANKFTQILFSLKLLPDMYKDYEGPRSPTNSGVALQILKTYISQNKLNLLWTGNYLWCKVGNHSKKSWGDLLQKITNTTGSLVALKNFQSIFVRSNCNILRL